MVFPVERDRFVNRLAELFKDFQLVIAVAAAEAAIGLAIVVGVFRNRHNTNLDDLTLLRY